MRFYTLLAALSSIIPSLAVHANYVDWRSFKAHGVNLGGWLVQESNIDSAFWAKYGGSADDEWGLCQQLGSQCGPVLERRYASFITTKDIDRLSQAGVGVLRIPTTYAAWINLPGSALYSGKQTTYLKKIADYAISTYGMHIIIDVHSLPGGINGLPIGEATGNWGWFDNQTALDNSLQAIDAVVDFVQHSGSPESYTIEPINEPADGNKKDMSTFGTAAVLSDKGAAWVAKYINAVLDHVAKVNPNIPVMFQGSFKNPDYWSGRFADDANLVFDVHVYHYEHPPECTSSNLASYLCDDAKQKSGDGKFPVFFGEWSIQAAKQNSLALRERNYNAGTAAFGHYAQGSCYWTAKFTGNSTVQGQGTQADYWNFGTFINKGWVHPAQGFLCNGTEH